MRRPATAIAALVLLLGSLVFQARAGPVPPTFLDDFNADTYAVPAGVLINNWSVVSGTVDVIGSGPSGTGFDWYPGNGYYLDMEGTPGNGAILSSTTFDLGPGRFLLEWDMGSNQNSPNGNVLQVQLGALYDAEHNAPTQPTTFTHKTATIDVGSAVTVGLTFSEVGAQGDQGGSILDNVQLSYVGPVPGGVIPEPFSMAFMGSAFVGVVACRLRKRRKEGKK